MYPSFLPGADNLSKYLLTIGFVLVFFVIVYPLQKEQKLKLDALNLLMEEELLQQDISGIIGKIDELKKDSVELNSSISSLKFRLVNTTFQDSLAIEKLILDKKQVFTKKIEDVELITESLQKKSVKLDFEIKKQNEVRAQISSYVWLEWIFMSIGVIFILLGFRFWLSSTYVDEMEKCHSLNQQSQISSGQSITITNSQTQQYESSFIRVRKWLKIKTKIIRRIIKI